MLHTYHTDYACLDMWQQWPHFDNVLIIYTNFVSFWCCTFSGNHYGTLIITFGLIVLKQYYNNCIHHIFLFDECSITCIYNYIPFVSIEHTCILLDECSIVSLLHFFVLNTHDHSNSWKTCCFNVLCMYNVKWNITLSIIHKCIHLPTNLILIETMTVSFSF